MPYAFKNCPKDVWTKIATGVRRGNVFIARLNITYLQAYVPTGQAPPADDEDGIPLISPGQKVRSPTDIDVYLYAKREDGKVRWDT